MSSSLYKIVEIYDEKENNWKLAKINGKYEFPCSFAVRDYLRCYNLLDVNDEELSEELQKIISENNKSIYPLRYRYHILEESLLEEIKDEYLEKITNIPDKKIKCDTNDKLNMIMGKLGIGNSEYEDDDTVEDIKETLDYYTEIVCGVEKDLSEVRLISMLCSDKSYGIKIRIIVYYC